MYTQYENDRLILKVLSPKAAGSVADFYIRNYEEFSLYEPLTAQTKTTSYHKKNLEFEYSLFSSGKFVRFFIFEKHDPFTIIGTLSYRDITHSFYDSCIIGYKMDKSKRRLGYCRDAICLGNKIMFDELKLNRIEATVRTGNIPSMRLLESLGFLNEGLLRDKIKLNGEYCDHYLYSMLKRDML